MIINFNHNYGAVHVLHERPPKQREGERKSSCAACPACPVGPEDRTWVAPADGTGVKSDPAFI